MRSPRMLSAVWLMLCLHALAAATSAQTLSRHPYLQMTTRDSAVVVWRTAGATTPIVRYGPAPDQLTEQILPVQMVVRSGPDVPSPAGQPKLHSAPFGTYQYEASAFFLQPGTTYYYGVFDGDILLAGADPDHRFTTLPAAGTDASLRLWVTGDSGTGTFRQRKAYEAMQFLTANESRPPDAFLHLGDMAYNVGNDNEFSSKFFNIYTDLLRNTVTWPTMGNHEGATSSGSTQIGPYYDAYVVPTQGEAGGVPSGTEAYYSFDIGPVHFICLNSHDLDRSPAGEMALWLKADLESTNGQWLIAFWHHPPYTKGTHDSDRETQLIQMREYIMPMLESGGVDLVLAGHSHIYERSMLIDGAYATPTIADGVILDDGDGHPQGDGAYRKSASLNPHEGTLAVVAGNGASAGNLSVSPVMRMTLKQVGSLILDIDGDTLTGRMVNSSKVVTDEFQLIKAGVVTPEIVEYPWQPYPPTFLVERDEPGATLVEIVPLVDAPDMANHYTTDGSEPTVASPIANGRVAIPDAGSVRAFSRWAGGDRVGPTGQSTPLDPGISVHRYVSSAADDAFEDREGNVFAHGETLHIGEGVTAVRFGDLKIPPHVHIVRAELQFAKAAPQYQWTATTGTVQAELISNSPPIQETPQNISSRTPTMAAVPWTVRAWTSYARRDLNTLSPDLSTLVNEVIRIPGWQSGNAMTFLIDQAGDRSAGSFDSDKSHSATLSVVYIDPANLVEELAAAPIELGAGYLAWRWPSADSAAALGLSYQVEGSPDLTHWVPVTPTAAEVALIGTDGWGELRATIPPEVFEGSNRYFLRTLFHQAP